MRYSAHRGSFNPRRWGFFISGSRRETVWPGSDSRVSIPVDGAFLFQVVPAPTEAMVRRFNPRRWGFFISGWGIESDDEEGISFNPRRWGFFISGKFILRINWRSLGVSIPVDGAFLFQGGEPACASCSHDMFQSP